MANPKTLSSSQVAEQLGVSVRTVHRMADDGRLTPYSQNRAGLIFRQSDIDALTEKPEPENVSGSG